MNDRSTRTNRSIHRGAPLGAAFAGSCLMLASLSLCSCTSSRPVVTSDPFIGESAPQVVSVAEEPAQQPAGRIRLSDPQRGSLPPASNAGAMAARREHGAAGAGIQQASFLDADIEASGAGRLAQASSTSAVSFSAAQPRNDVGSPRSGVQTAGHQHPYWLPELPPFPDEYLLDGGDRSFPVHRNHTGVSGLDTEDTVAEFADHAGKRHTLPSNRVAIYSPRFSAVRSVSGLESGFNVAALASAADADRSSGVRTRVSSNYHSQRDMLDGVRVRSRASGFESPSHMEGLDQATYASAHVTLLNAFEDLAFVQGGQLLQSEKARLGLAMQAAIVWNRDQYPVATASIDAIHQVTARFKPQELVGVEDERTPGKLRLVKLADRKVAAPGEIVTFTIRYDNLGDRELNDLQIVDNLTPRLEYVKDSASSDKDGRLDVEDNGEGSALLTFRLKGPLEGHQGGVLTFKARVR